MEGISVGSKVVDEHCEGCALGKQTRYPFPKNGSNKTKEVLELVHSGKLLTGKNRNVIVRFMNRKYPYMCLRNSKKLALSKVPEYKKLYLIGNLCLSFKKIFNYLYKLKKDNKILDL